MTLRFRKWPLEDLWIDRSTAFQSANEAKSYRIDRRKPDGRFALFIPGIERRSQAMYFDTLKEAKAAADCIAGWKVAK